MPVFPDPRTGLIQIEWREGGRRLTKSLGHRDWDRAKRQADAVAAGRVQPSTPVELRPLPSAPALQIPELLPSPALQSASSADAPRPAARPPLPLLVSFRPLREAQLAAAQPRRFPALRVEPGSRSRARAGVRPGAPRSAPGASPAPAPSGSPSLARAQLCRSGASSLAQLQAHGRHMDATTNSLALHYHRLSS